MQIKTQCRRSWSERMNRFAQLETNCPIQIRYNAYTQTHKHAHICIQAILISILPVHHNASDRPTNAFQNIILCITDAQWRTAVSIAARNKSGNFVLCSEAAQPTSNHKVSGFIAVALPRYKAMTTTCVSQYKAHSNDNRKNCIKFVI